MRNSQELANIIKKIAKSKKIPIGKMLSECDLSVNTLSSMQSGGYFPRLEAISKIADYLNCSIDYLLGRTDNPEYINISQGNYVSNSAINTIAQNYGQGTQTVREAAPSSSPSEECAELVRIYTALPFRQRVELLNMALRLEGEASGS